MKAFNLTAQDSEHIIDAVNEVSNNTAVSSADLATNIGKASAALAAGGNTYEDTLSMMTGIVEITRNGAKASRGLISVQSRYNQIIDETSSTGQKLTKWYKQHNIAIKDEQGQQRKLYDTLTDVSKIWNTLSKDEQLYYLNIQAGANQTQNLSALLTNFNQVLYAHELALNSDGSAINENARAMENLNKRIDAVKAAWKSLVIELADSEQIGNLLDTVASILNTIANNEKAINAILTIGKALAIYTGLKISKNIFSGFITSGKNAVVTGKKVVSVLKSIISSLKELPKYIATIKALGLKDSLTWLKSFVPWVSKLGPALAAITPWLVAFAAVGVSSGKFSEWYNKSKIANTDDIEEQAEAYKNLVVAYEKYEGHKGKGYRKVSGDKAIAAEVERIGELNEKYKQGKLSVEEYMDKVGDITNLENYYNALSAIVDKGDSLTPQQAEHYNQLKALFSTYGKVSTKAEEYANAMKIVETYTDDSITVNSLFKDSLTAAGGEYKFVSKAAKEAAQKQLETEMALTEATLAQVSTRMAAKLSEFGVYEEYVSSFFANASPTAAGAFASSEEGKKALALAETYYKIKQLKDKVDKMKITKTTTVTDDEGDGDGDSDKQANDAQQKLEQRKKWLENYITAQRELYQKGEIDATTYYSNVQKKGKKYYDQLKAMGSDYADAAESMLEQYKSTNTTAVKDIFTEIEYQYKQGRITGQEYYEQLWKYAKKFYKNGKIEFSDYRDYIEKGYTELFGSIEQEYENGTITAEQYAKRVAEAQSAALKKINASGFGASVKKELKTALTDAVKEAKVSVAKALKEAAVAAAEAAVEAAEKKLEEAEAALSKSEAFISALDFYAQEQMDAIDKVIEGYNAEIDKLNEKKELLDEQNDALDKQAERIKLVNELEDAKKQKTVRLYDSRYGWIWSADQSKVKQAQEALDEFDTTQKREKEKKAIENEVKAIEKLIKQKESEKQAYQDVIDEQTKALNRYNIEAELGKTIEEAIFDARTQNFTNWKDNYLIGTQEVIEATERVTQAQEALNKAQENLNIEQNRDWSSYDVDTTTTTPTKTTETRYTTKTNQPYEYDYSKTAVENWNAGQKANLAYYDKLGKKYKKWTDDDGKIHYKLLAKGSLGVPKSAIYNVNELGDELIVPPKGNFDYLKKGTGVIPANLTKNLMDWGKFNPSNFALNNQPSSVTNDHSITIQNLTVQSDNAKDFVRQLQNLAIVRS